MRMPAFVISGLLLAALWPEADVRARPFAPTVEELKAFAGRYESDELLASIELTPGTAGLKVVLNRVRPLGLEFLPVDHDTFQMGAFTIRFVRDGAEWVTGLDPNSPVFRRASFKRVSPVSADR